MQKTLFNILLIAGLMFGSLNAHSAAVALNGKVTLISLYTPIISGTCKTANCYGNSRLIMKMDPKPHTNCKGDFYMPVSDPRSALLNTLLMKAMQDKSRIILSYDDKIHPEDGDVQDCHIQGVELKALEKKKR